MKHSRALMQMAAVFVLGCGSRAEWPTVASPTSEERTVAPGDSVSYQLPSGWTIDLDARSSRRAFQFTIRDTQRGDWPGPPSATGIELVYAPLTGDTLPRKGAEIVVRLTRQLPGVTRPQTASMFYLTAPPPANVASIAQTTCVVRADANGTSVSVSTVFSVGVGDFGPKAYLAFAPYLWDKQIGDACK